MNMKSIFAVGEGLSNYQLRLRQLDFFVTHVGLIIAIVFFGALQIDSAGIVLRYVPLFLTLTISHIIYIKLHHRLPVWVIIAASIGILVISTLWFLGLIASTVLSQRLVNDDLHALASKAGLPEDPTYSSPKTFTGAIMTPDKVPTRSDPFSVYSIIPSSMLLVVAFESLVINLALFVGICVDFHRRRTGRISKHDTQSAYKLDG